MARRAGSWAELLFGVAVIAAVLSLVLGSVVVGVGLAAKSRSDAFLAMSDELVIGRAPQRSVVLDARGRPLAWLWRENRQDVPLGKIAPVLRQALIDVEDSRFYDNHGIDLRGVTRALVRDQVEVDDRKQGASTLTQQYVKNLLLLAARSKTERQAATEQSYDRKLREARYALGLGQRLSKDEILTGYLNLVFFGNGAYGVHVAAETYFSTSPAALTAPQAAVLVGLLQNPSRYDPIKNPAPARARRDVVLARMAELGHLTPAALAAAQAAPLGLRPGRRSAGCYGSSNGYFCDWILEQLRRDPALGPTPEARQSLLETGGLVIRTTLDPAVQAAAVSAVARSRGSRAALATAVVEPGTGKVLSLAASVPFGVRAGESSVNLPLGGSAGFQTGSTFKIFVLAHAVAVGIPLGHVLHAPQTYASTKYAPFNPVPGKGFQPYSVSNAGDSEAGDFTLEQATWHSVNTYFIQLQEAVGIEGPARLAEALGVRRADGSALQRVPSFTLGTNEVAPLAMAGAYAAFAAHGTFCPPHGIVGITDAAGRPVRTTTARPCAQVVDPTVADTVTRTLIGVVEQGTGTAARLNRRSAGKTGTVQGFSAAWYVGYTPELAAAVWMGDPRGGFRHPLLALDVAGKRYAQMYGGQVPAQTWAAVVGRSLAGTAPQPFRLRPPRIPTPAPTPAQ